MAREHYLSKKMSPIERAYHYILEAILSGELVPGMRVATETVAEDLGISRMPVRDALRQLEGDGVVTIVANRGASVAEFTTEEVVELIEMRAVLEGLAARMALPIIGPTQIAELEHLLWRMDNVQEDLSAWITAHDEFHNYLTACCEKPLLIQEAQRMRLMLRPYFRKFYAESREFEIAGLEHRTIVDTVKIGDTEAVENVVRAHVRQNVDNIATLA
ncbi:GntR family transcriptional regulator [Roseivivax sp. THAF30]|uniref:GntR family transcriptional regulator n=2 Tax=unclassified Roseivivax TaxID=2639302 RepID=UPI0012AA3810|nr:GntR family transcriptional regulator [Roseivivax sp. THAF30]QFT48934.1 HTH-type transcriptional repressor CsiR [Roseivivax sp. THAF40]QFT65088.1 HTH-type transcriptional repressor CsiR [Roseivivax sp. THAF30]